jgi:hypothetical protein
MHKSSLPQPARGAALRHHLPDFAETSPARFGALANKAFVLKFIGYATLAEKGCRAFWHFPVAQLVRDGPRIF